MAVHVRLEGDRDAAQTYLPLAQQLLHKVRQLAALSGSAISAQHLNPNEFTLIYAMKMAGFEVIQIHCTPPSEGATSLATQTLPDILSGWTRDATITEEPGPPVRKYLTAFKPSDSMKKPGTQGPAANWGRSQQLAVAPSDVALEFPPRATDATDSQYRRVFASNYSGAMAKCVQTLLGYGRPKKTTLLQGKPLPAGGTQVVYDYRFYRTHGLTKVGDDWWLVEISSARGIVACELEMFPGSYARGKASSRKDVKEMAEALHGLPTGRGMLQGAVFDAAVLAGTAIQLMTPEELTAKFYKDWLPHSTALGWLFSPDGTQAHNTAWKQKQGRREGAHFMIELKLAKGQDGKIEGSARIDLCDLGNLPDYEVLDAYEPLTDQLAGDLGKQLSLGYFVRTPQEGQFSAPVHVYWGEDGVEVWRYRSDSSMKNYQVKSGGGRQSIKIPVWPPNPDDPGAMEDFAVPVQSFTATTVTMSSPAAGIYRPDEPFEHQATQVFVEAYEGGHGGQAFAVVSATDVVSDNPSDPLASRSVSASVRATQLIYKISEIRSTFLPLKESAELRVVPQNLRDGFAEFWRGESGGPGLTSWERGLGYEAVEQWDADYYRGRVDRPVGTSVLILTSDEKKGIVYQGRPENVYVAPDEDPRLTARKRLVYESYKIAGLGPTFPPALSDYLAVEQMVMGNDLGMGQPLPANSFTTGDEGDVSAPRTLRVMAFGKLHEVEWLSVFWGGGWPNTYFPPQCSASAIGTPAVVVSRTLTTQSALPPSAGSSFFIGALQGEDMNRPPKQFNFIGAP